MLVITKDAYKCSQIKLAWIFPFFPFPFFPLFSLFLCVQYYHIFFMQWKHFSKKNESHIFLLKNLVLKEHTKLSAKLCLCVHFLKDTIKYLNSFPKVTIVPKNLRILTVNRHISGYITWKWEPGVYLPESVSLADFLQMSVI